MNYFKAIKDNLSQIFAVVEKDLKLYVRFKLPVLMSFIMPILNLVLPLIIMGQIFTFNEDFGPWNSQNFAIYVLTAYQIGLMTQIYNRFPSKFATEKIWKTLYAIIIAPFNRRNLLFGIFFTHMIINAVPFTIFLIISLIILHISILSIISLIIFYFLIALIFSGIGLFLGALAISKPSLTPLIRLGLRVIFLFSCLGMPFEFFPEYFQAFVIFDPFYYLFDFIRAIWIYDDIFLSIVTHPFHVFLIVGGAVILPLVGLWIFNFIFNKYGIIGY